MSKYTNKQKKSFNLFNKVNNNDNDYPNLDEVNSNIDYTSGDVLNMQDDSSNGSGKSARSAVFYLMILSAFTKLFGFGREILLANYYGVGDVAEAYKIAQTIPIIILMIVGAGISTGFIPTYNKAYAEEGEKKADRFTSNAINIVVILGLIFCIIVNLFPGLFVKIFASGFEGEKLQLSILFTRIAVFGTIFSMISYILQPYLQIKENFWVPAMVGIPMNIIFFLSYPLASKYNLIILPIGIVLSVLVQLIWMWPWAKKEGFKYKPIVDINDKHIQHLLILAAPVILGVAVNQINIVIDKNMASWVIDGGVAALDYANRMNGFVQGIFIYSVVAVVYPKISKMFIAKNIKEVESTVTNSLVTISLVVIPCIVGLMVFSEPIIRFLFYRGEFDDRAALMTSGGMFWYAAGLIGFGYREILSRVFYSMNDTKTPTINAAIAVVINIVLNLILSRIMGLNGLALATSIASIVGSLLLMISLRKRGKIKLKYRDLTIKVVKIVIASVVMGIISFALFLLLTYIINYKISLIFSIFFAVFIYAIQILIAKIPEVDEFINLIKAKSKRNRT
ncbi:MAG: murein biosynthesis integral membrane protein MurJ [Clostridiaceae bacterium]